MLTINVNIETLVANVKGQKHAVDISDLHIEGIRKVMEYGFQRYLNDACGGEKTEEDIRAICAKRITMLKTGNLGVTRTRGASADNGVKAENMVASAILTAKGIVKKAEAGRYIKELREFADDAGRDFFVVMVAAVKNKGKAVAKLEPNAFDEAEFAFSKQSETILAAVARKRAELDALSTPEVEVDF